MGFPDIKPIATNEQVAQLEDEIKLLTQALTKSISMSKGAMPRSEQYYTVLINGIAKVKKQQVDV